MATITRTFKVEVTIPDNYESSGSLTESFGGTEGDFEKEGKALLDEFDKAPESRIADFIARRLREGWTPSSALIFFSFVQFGSKAYRSRMLLRMEKVTLVDKLRTLLGGLSE